MSAVAGAEGEEASAGLALLEAAAGLTRLVDRDSRPEQVVATVRAWARSLGGRIASDTSVRNRLRMLNHFFFDELGFHGEQGNDCADAGYLHRVIERRAGVADSLALLYMEIGRSIGLRMVGLALADSFLVKLNCNGCALVIDVAERGCTLSAEQLRSKLSDAMPGRGARQGDRDLQQRLREISEDDMLLAFLRNIGRRHRAAGQWGSALAVQSLLVERLPSSRLERLRRAELYERLECPRAAAADLAQCLTDDPDGSDAAELHGRYLRLRHRASRLH
jgi:regulator of sirC expression with transglutaminase-like and TPR domain